MSEQDKTSKVAQTRKRIVKAALAVMLECEGELSMTAVCKEAGITRTTLYRYFSNKDDIIHCVFDEFRLSFEEGMYTAIARDPQAERRLEVIADYMCVCKRAFGIPFVRVKSEIYTRFD